MKFNPLFDRVLLKRKEALEKTAGGIYIPPTAQERPQECEVVAVGPGRMTDHGVLIPPPVKAGDFVLIGKWAGNEIEDEGTKYVLVRADDILAILEP